MSTNSIGSTSGSAATQAAQRPPATSTVKTAGSDTDGDRDGSSAKVPPSSKPSVNTSGQQTGTVVNTKA